MSAKFGTPVGEELDAFAMLLCAYKEEHVPMDSPDPVVAAQFRTEQQGLPRKVKASRKD